MLFRSGLTEVGSGAIVSAPDQAAGVFEEFAGQIGTAASDLEGISAPDEVAGAHDEIVQNLRTLEDAATGAADDIRNGGPVAVAGVAAQFLTEANRIGSEIDSMIVEINLTLQG